MSALNSSDVSLKVTPTVLHSKSIEASKHIRSMKQYFDEMTGIIKRTSAYWVGDAGDLHRRSYADQESRIEEIFKRLREHPTDLQTIAQVYSDVEFKVEEIANELPGDVII